MASQRHEIPTHLNVEDRAIYGLSVRQVMFLTSGFSLGYGLWNQAGDLPTEARAAVAVACAIGAIVFAVVRPAGRGLEDWVFVVLRFVTTPRASVWRPRERDADSLPASEAAWADLAPLPSWTEGRR